MCHRTGPKGWMDRKIFVEWLRELDDDEFGIRKIVYLDNCGGHNETPETLDMLRQKNVELRRLPANATDLCQPADSFLIQKIKEEWNDRWNKYKRKLIEDNQYCNKPRSDGAWSGKLKNPGKQYYLRLADECIKAVNEKTDENGISYARKAMIRCGLAKDITGSWSESQLFQHLQNIINDYREYFDGKPVTQP